MTTYGFTSAGTILGISSTAPGSIDLAGYRAASFTTIGEITDMGELGKVFSEITHRPLDQRGEYVFKGNFSRGTMNLNMAVAFSDAGQVILDAALDDDEDYYFSLQLNDNSGDGNQDTFLFFSGKIMSSPISIGNADSITTQSVTLRVNSDLIKSPAITVATPTLTVEGSPASVPVDPELTGTAFTVSTGTDTHLSTDWQVLDDGVVEYESLANTVNLLTITLPAATLTNSTEYTFRVRYRSAFGAVTAWSTVTATTIA